MLIFAPLKNFSSPKTRIPIDPNSRLYIVQFSNREMTQIRSSFMQRPGWIPDDEISIITKHFNLYRQIDLPTKIDWKSDELRNTVEIFENIIGALALFKDGLVWFNQVYSIDPLGSASELNESSWELVPKRESRYLLAKDEIVLFSEWWRLFSCALRGNRRFNRALERFKQVWRRHHHFYFERNQYHLVDVMIGLESLFGTGTGESSHKVSRRAAILLGKDKGERIRIASHLRLAYALRSAIVHGGEFNTEKTPGTLSVAESNLRLALRTIVNRRVFTKTDMNALIQMLDFGQ